MRIVALLLVVLTATACASPTVAELDGRRSGTNSPVRQLTPPGVTDVLADARARVDENLAGRNGFTPPSHPSPAVRGGSTIAFVAADLTNGGVNTVSQGVAEAAAAIGWQVVPFDGKGSAQGRADALNQAIASRPAGIVLGGFDATEQWATIKQAGQNGVPVVGWHAGTEPGPIPHAGVFTNVTTDPLEVAWLAAAHAIAESGGRAGVVVLTDSQYEIAVRKAQAMRAYVELCSGCAVLSYEDSPIADADARMPSLVSSLLQRNGDRLGYLLGVNGNYFGAAKSALRDAGRPAAGSPFSIAAGDGDAAEFQRIRTGDYQAATVAEPMLLHGWQLVDELNRAIAGRDPSGFVAKPALITKRSVPSGAVFDPQSGYREIYLKVWGKS
ncbi:monosaccharide ABC transporter substrate-binding protein (CUT2 family) [Lentzea atacamensis]|uniref:Monosaccharide ABC transporter substrate-binding protein (CUT2 family) n=1 Tax=Lentzea atacamensis TaxID=531938 RepID=A0ABX9E9V1_9PSEU|nr:substrate-binding domain-containing protein [Lentzea atacamensis]RAS66935.1 monosaccharide ABC transporter substrate-binding protein (CUT2 family) [Lentzea atacamensis]